MRDKQGKKYCLVDHANKQKDLARLPPYEFWVNQVKRRRSADAAVPGSEGTSSPTGRKAG